MERCTNLKSWETYEQVATYLLNMIAKELGLERVEGKQKLAGASGADWEVDAKGITQGQEAFVVVECRHTKARQSQSKVAALAYSIRDTGATGGIIVTSVPLQTGAQKVATTCNILHVQIDLNSTPEDFSIKFLNKLFLGVSAGLCVSGEATCNVSRACNACGKQFERIGDEHICPTCSSTSKR